MVNNFLTPQDCLVKQIENDSTLCYICEKINSAALSSFKLGESFKVEVDLGKELTWETLSFLKNVYKRFGWKVTSQGYKKTDSGSHLTLNIEED